MLVCNDTSVGKIIIVEETCEQIPPWLQREMVQCTETEASDGNEADRGSELSDNEECRRREVTSTAANDRVNKATSSNFLLSLTVSTVWNLCYIRAVICTLFA